MTRHRELFREVIESTLTGLESAFPGCYRRLINGVWRRIPRSNREHIDRTRRGIELGKLFQVSDSARVMSDAKGAMSDDFNIISNSIATCEETKAQGINK